ncbi:hypothetical protein ABK040_006237 [Willaertia magna]
MKQKTLESNNYFLEVELRNDSDNTNNNTLEKYDITKAIQNAIKSVYGITCQIQLNFEILYYSKKNKLLLLAVDKNYYSYFPILFDYINNNNNTNNNTASYQSNFTFHLVKATPYFYSIISNNRLYLDKLLKK